MACEFGERVIDYLFRDVFNDFVKTCWQHHVERGWPTSSPVAERLALIHSEISEALEGYRRGVSDEHLPHRPSIEVELADAVIRIACLAGQLNLDLAGAIVEKDVFNATRPDHDPVNRTRPGGKKF